MAIVILASLPSLASEAITARKIVSLGCHNTDGTCYVRVDGAPFGGALGCSQGTSHDSFRFDNSNEPQGKRAYASLLAAMVSGRQIEANLDGCSAQGFPKLFYFTIY